jgi:hypothetical protein
MAKARVKFGEDRAAASASGLADLAGQHAFVALAYKDSPFLPGCLDSLRAQTVQSRILVATSTPSDFIARTAADHGLDVVVNPKREGIAADWNFGLRTTGARLVTLAHQDDLYAPAFLAETLAALRRGGAVCFTGYQEIDDEGCAVSSKISRAKHAIEALTLGGARVVRGARLRAYLSFGNPLPCSSVTYDLDRLGDFAFSHGFSSNLDWDAWWRLMLAGETFVRAPARLVGRRHNALTATSQLLCDGVRRVEDLAMFRRAWPGPLAHAIATAYRSGY